jgi:hypothetical protein
VGRTGLDICDRNPTRFRLVTQRFAADLDLAAAHDDAWRIVTLLSITSHRDAGEAREQQHCKLESGAGHGSSVSRDGTGTAKVQVALVVMTGRLT